MIRYYLNPLNKGRFCSVPGTSSKTLFTLFFAFSVLLFTSCEEDPTSIGKGILPQEDFVAIRSIDTLSAFSYTRYDSLARTDNPSTAYMGQMYDPYFGTTTASFVTQLRLGQVWEDANYTIDAVKLHMVFKNVRGGGSDVSPSMRITEIAEKISVDQAYNSGKNIALTGNVWNIALPFLKPDTAISVNMPVSFAERLIRNKDSLFHSNSKPDFRSYFKGLYFQLNPTADPLLVSVGLNNEQSPGFYANTFIIHITNDLGIKKEYFFIIDAVNRNAAYNIFKHDFKAAPDATEIKNINKNFRDTLSYLQSMNGVYTRVVFPGLEVIKNNPLLDRIAINKARLTVPYHTDDNIYKAGNAPSKLYMRYRTSTGNKFYVPDLTINQEFFDGTADTINKVYNFNLATFVQLYLEDVKNEILPEVEIVHGVGTNNLILKANSSKKPLKFDFTYTLF